MPIVFLLVSLTIVLTTFASAEDKTQVAPPKTELDVPRENRTHYCERVLPSRECFW
jgi:hypothetical protein